MRAIFPGSFDPITYGHVDIVNRSLKIFDEIVVGVLNNINKDSFFSIEERVEMISEVFAEDKRVVVQSFSGLLVDFSNKMDCKAIIRGLRATSDYDYEAQMALMNRSIDKELETFFLMSTEQHSYISSSLVKNVAPFGASVERLVPKAVEKALRSRFS